MKSIRVLSLIVPAFLLGCGGADGDADRPATFPVTGIVTYNGSPVADATVTFNPEANTGKAAFGRSDAEGHYELMTFEAGDGAVAGKYIVTVTKYDTPPVPTSTTDEINEDTYVPPEASGATREAAPKSLVPAKYGQMHTSDLRADVTESGENNFDFKLAD